MSTEVQTTARSPREAGSLAVKLAKARSEMIECYERHQGLSPQEAVARIRELDTDQYAQFVLQKPLRETNWNDMNALAAVDPELSAERWSDMVDEARDELDSGHRAAQSLNSVPNAGNEHSSSLYVMTWPRNGSPGME